MVNSTGMVLRAVSQYFTYVHNNNTEDEVLKIKFNPARHSRMLVKYKVKTEKIQLENMYIYLM